MSIKVGIDEGARFGVSRAIERFRTGAASAGDAVAASGRSLNARAKQAQKAAKREAHQELQAAERQLKSRTAVRQNGLELWPLPGIAAMTRVRTSFGDVHAAALRKGDEVLTRSGKYKPILWLNRIHLDEHVLSLKPDSNPVVIAPGALGSSSPISEMMVSPRQIICADDSSGLSKPREASMLISRPGIRRLTETCLSYTMFHVGESADICCEGIYLSFPLEA